MTWKDIILLSGFRGKKSKKIWTYIGGVLIYMLISIWLSHISESKAKYISALNRENRRLRSEYISLQSRLMTRQLRSNIYAELKDEGFVLPKRPPYQIVKDE